MLFAALCVSVLSLVVLLGGGLLLLEEIRASERRWLAELDAQCRERTSLSHLLAIEQLWSDRFDTARTRHDQEAEQFAGAALCSIVRRIADQDQEDSNGR